MQGNKKNGHTWRRQRMQNNFSGENLLENIDLEDRGDERIKLR
jgi:hypothetical protein